MYRGLWKGTPVAIKKWFDPSMSEEMMQEFRYERVWECLILSTVAAWQSSFGSRSDSDVIGLSGSSLGSVTGMGGDSTCHTCVASQLPCLSILMRDTKTSMQGFQDACPIKTTVPSKAPPTPTHREEVMTLQALRHPNVLQFLGASMMPPNLVMVTEHMPHSLHTVLYSMQNVDLDRKRIVALLQVSGGSGGGTESVWKWYGICMGFV